MSLRDLSNRTGFSRSMLSDLFQKRDWSGVDIDVVVSVSEACGVHLNNPRQARAFLRESKQQHIFRGGPNQRKSFAKLFRRELRQSAAKPEAMPI